MKLRLARSVVLAVGLGALACRSAPTPQKREPVEASAPAPLPTVRAEDVVVDEPVARFGFDAGGRAEIDIPTVACNDDGQVGPRTVTLPRTLKVPVTKELAALDNPASQLRVYSNGSSTRRSGFASSTGTPAAATSRRS